MMQNFWFNSFKKIFRITSTTFYKHRNETNGKSVYKCVIATNLCMSLYIEEIYAEHLPKIFILKKFFLNSI